MFGGTASEERIREEMLGYSDYQIHRFCLSSGSKRIARRQLPPDAVRRSPLFCSCWTNIVNMSQP